MLSNFCKALLGQGYSAWMTTSIFLVAMAAPIYAADAQLTVYAELEEAANFPDEDSDPVPIGPAFDIVKAVLAEAGYQADVRVVPWARVMHSLESQDNVLAFSMTRTPDREDRFHWIGLLRPVAFKMWALPERAAVLPASLEDAKNLRVSAERGDVAERYLLAEGFTNLIYLSQESNTLTMLRRDRIDLMVYIESGMPGFLARKNEPPGTLVPVYDLDEISTGHYMVMSKQSDPELVQLLQDSYQAVVDSGRFDHLIRPGQD